jgi:hypothetical protein
VPAGRLFDGVFGGRAANAYAACLPACLPACLREIPSCGCMLFVGLCRSLLYILEMVNGNELMLGLLGLFCGLGSGWLVMCV